MPTALKQLFLILIKTYSETKLPGVKMKPWAGQAGVLRYPPSLQMMGGAWS